MPTHQSLGGASDDDIRVATVPGALESPLALQRFAQTGEFSALVALGAVIRGETYHFEIVSNESAAGISSVQLEFGADGRCSSFTEYWILPRGS